MKALTGVAPSIDNHQDAITHHRIAQRIGAVKGREIVRPSSRSRRPAFALLMLLVSSTTWAADVKVHGATTVADGLMNPQKAKIEQLAGVTLAILASSTEHGLADLVQGRADIAMLAESLESAAEALNRMEPGLINLTDYTGRHVGNTFVQFIVHPSNPIQKLTNAQLAGLYSGTIKNWSEIGGNNQLVLLVGGPTSSPYRLIKEALAVSYASGLRVVQNTNQTAIIVAQAPGALANISKAHNVPERSKFKVVETDLKLPLQLYLAIRKNAPDQVKRVVDVAALLGGQ
jgi:ABC-type phosphate transport system substrate-binding protein